MQRMDKWTGYGRQRGYKHPFLFVNIVKCMRQLYKEQEEEQKNIHLSLKHKRTRTRLPLHIQLQKLKMKPYAAYAKESHACIGIFCVTSEPAIYVSFIFSYQ